MIVGTYLTGVAWNAPPSGYWAAGRPGSGTHDGTIRCFPAGLIHWVTLSLSQPHPFSPVVPFGAYGLLPVKPSRLPATAYRCPPHDGESAIENVSSEMANRPARVVRLGTCDGWKPVMHW